MKIRRAAAVLAMAATALLTSQVGAGWAGTPAPAPAVPATCPADSWYNYSSVVVTKFSLVRPAYGEPGVTISIALTAGATATATATITGTAGISGIVANASLSIGVSLSLSLTAAVTYSGSYHVPLNVHYAYLYAGAVGRAFAWSKHQYVNCIGKMVAYGSARAPSAMPAFWGVNH